LLQGEVRAQPWAVQAGTHCKMRSSGAVGRARFEEPATSFAMESSEIVSCEASF
jgi:hypothetical protein